MLIGDTGTWWQGPNLYSLWDDRDVVKGGFRGWRRCFVSVLPVWMLLSVSNPDARGVDLYYCRPNRDVTERKHAKYLIIRVDQFEKVMGEERISRVVMQAVTSFWFAASYYTEKQTDKWRWMERDRHGEKRRNDHILIHQIPSSVSQSRS